MLCFMFVWLARLNIFIHADINKSWLVSLRYIYVRSYWFGYFSIAAVDADHI